MSDVQTLRTLIADDERIARERLRAMLEEAGGVEIVAECHDGADTVGAIRALRPEVVFLDVRMPELDGIDVVRAVGPDEMPCVVFVTAFDQYAIQAFEIQALDYLLKPYDETRLRAALARARTRVRGTTYAAHAAHAAQLRALVAAAEPPAPLDRVIVKHNGRLLVVRVADVDWVEADDNYVRLHVGTKAHLLRGKITALEAKLDPRRFARVHRGTIVNLDRVRELQPTFRGEYVAILASGVRLAVSATYRAALLARLGDTF